MLNTLLDSFNLVIEDSPTSPGQLAITLEEKSSGRTRDTTCSASWPNAYRAIQELLACQFAESTAGAAAKAELYATEVVFSQNWHMAFRDRIHQAAARATADPLLQLFGDMLVLMPGELFQVIANRAVAAITHHFKDAIESRTPVLLTDVSSVIRTAMIAMLAEVATMGTSWPGQAQLINQGWREDVLAQLGAADWARIQTISQTTIKLLQHLPPISWNTLTRGAIT